MNPRPAYDSTAAASERVAWRLDDVLTEDAAFDFSRPFLPERLAEARALSFLSRDEQRVLNHVRAHGYLCLFGLVEEFILPYVLDQARARLDAPSDEIRSLLQFASEEAKHIALFNRSERRRARRPRRPSCAPFRRRCRDEPTTSTAPGAPRPRRAPRPPYACRSTPSGSSTALAA